VRIGCVHERVDDLLAQPARAVAVSSLPFRSLPGNVAATTIAAIERFLLDHPERRLVQYSYGLRAPFAFRDARLAWRRVERVWRNVPPAIVWVAGSRLP
jgi:phospholipid N-methyltransferase